MTNDQPAEPYAPHPNYCPTPGVCNCRDMPRCPSCGYTAHDAAHLMDHRFCDEPDPPNPRKTAPDGYLTRSYND